MKQTTDLQKMSATLILSLMLVSGPASSLNAQGEAWSDATKAEQLLASARGANPVICELAIQSIDSRYGNWSSHGRIPDGIIGQRDLVEWAARDIEDADAVPMLGAALTDDDTCVRRIAARLLGRVKHPSAAITLIRRLEDGDDRTRQVAAVGLGYSESPEAVESLLRSLNDGVGAVRAAASWALGEIEDERAVEALTRLLSEDPDPMVRRQVAWALGNMY